LSGAVGVPIGVVELADALLADRATAETLQR
jgi:hypothetical protein